MGNLFCCSMSLVGEEEMVAYVQRGSVCMNLCFGQNGGVFTEPASFNEPKPIGLHRLSDDHWAALKLRVDPLARHILDPQKSYVGAAFLCFLMTAVFSAIRPGWDPSSLASYHQNEDLNDDFGDDGFDDYGGDNGDDNDNGRGDYYIDDDVVLAELSYRNVDVAQALFIWRLMFYSFLTILCLSTMALAIGMEQRNANFDHKIRLVCVELRPRFQREGFSLDYRTRLDSPGILRFWQYVRPERVIIFSRIAEIDHEIPTLHSLYSSPSSTSNNYRIMNDHSGKMMSPTPITAMPRRQQHNRSKQPYCSPPTNGSNIELT
mmetsp:Transcript_13570/g.24598  ORF Transcript_13570/g.24598 Transcript_13570/m.24598 type:complete len:319 (-) Transcript_13570:173-1129(-)|eukprot:CAMPEP_0198295240 /NCGR_PEP_ID=MMETSP1449-20131203/26692_1 /TAXON_ID=420275 /ORGANISM="Attheya septentrionalis, Strain CCMP2084" /LENGTH=318 /DNA_ID=CAMNT_0043995481 /DNA_START=196 /DNA_END=1152 /DNA_ORIENTATION=-